MPSIRISQSQRVASVQRTLVGAVFLHRLLEVRSELAADRMAHSSKSSSGRLVEPQTPVPDLGSIVRSSFGRRSASSSAPAPRASSFGGAPLVQGPVPTTQLTLPAPSLIEAALPAALPLLAPLPAQVCSSPALKPKAPKRPVRRRRRGRRAHNRRQWRLFLLRLRERFYRRQMGQISKRDRARFASPLSRRILRKDPYLLALQKNIRTRPASKSTPASPRAQTPSESFLAAKKSRTPRPKSY